MDKLKKFISKYKIAIIIVVLLLISFFVYLLAFAESDEDKYANQIEVTNASVTIVDGSEPFDKNDDPGNDSRNDNQVVRNFDSIVYNITYDLNYKEGISPSDEDEGQSNDDLVISRTVIIDVFLPKDISADICQDENTCERLFIGEIDEYNYYQFSMQGIVIGSGKTASIMIKQINSKDGTQIKPIIIVREATDKDATPIDENGNVDLEKGIKDIASVTVSAKKNYWVKLYPGTVIKDQEDDSKATIPVGFIVYLPNDQKNPNKGIKGIQIPDSISFNLHISSDNEEISEIIDNPTIGSYDSSYTIDNIPNPYAEGNGKVSYEGSNGMYTISVESLQYHNSSISQDDPSIYLSSNMFVFNTQRKEDADVKYTISATSSDRSTIFDSIDDHHPILFAYEKYVGDYTTTINFSDISTPSTNNASGESVYNYNEEFYIQDVMKYGTSTQSGDAINGFTNYIKIDNSAINILPLNNNVDETKEYSIEFTGTNTGNPTKDNYIVEYGVGEWTADNFTLNSSSSCPTNLTKEQLMNLYGGPCISELSDEYWFDSIDEAKAKAKEKEKGIILIRFRYFGEFNPGTGATLTLKAKARNNSSNVGKTFQVVSRASTQWDDRTYYLSEKSMYELGTSSIGEINRDYVKTEYDNNYNIQSGTNLPSGAYGNTILVSAFKTSLLINITDSYDSNRHTIYSQINDPIEIMVTPVVTLSDTMAEKESATVDIYLPQSLELLLEKEDRIYSNSQVINVEGVNYNVYTYTFTKDEIFNNNGIIPNFSLHAYVALNTSDNDGNGTSAVIRGIINAQTKSSNGTHSAVTSEAKRTTLSDTLTLRNTNLISSNGSLSTNYIDKNGQYTYKMRAVNLSGNDEQLELLYILPYSGDSIGEGSKFSGTLSISIVDKLPEGYNALYTKDKPNSILRYEISENSEVNWTQWKNYNTDTSGITAIKIVPTSKIPNNQYFASESGITLKIKTSKNSESDIYYNVFNILRKNVSICKDEEESDECKSTVLQTIYSPSNISNISVYSRTISGVAFEDFDYDGYKTNEITLNNLNVELYKLEVAEDADPSNPLTSIENAKNVELISETTTNNEGRYSFNGLKAGNYYVKIDFNCDKYTVTEKNKISESTGDTSSIDSDFVMMSGKDSEKTCSAVSNIIILDQNNIRARNIDLGLRVRQNFDINIKKYITKVVINSDKGSETKKFDNQAQVKIDVKNLKNTSFRVTYGFEIENSKYFPGTIGTIMEIIPNGMTFDPTLPENDGWYESDGVLYYTKLNNIYVLPDEKYHMTLSLDLVTDEGGEYVNVISASDLKPYEINANNFGIGDIEEDNSQSDGEYDDEFDDDSSDDFFDDEFSEEVEQ